MPIVRTLLLTQLFAACLPALTANADVSLPTVFDDAMVLQRDLPVPVWGRAEPGEAVTVRFANQRQATTAGDDGRWMVILDPLQTSSTGRRLVVEATNTIQFADVLVGEVWLCSGQSNMADSFNAKKGRRIPAPYMTQDLSRFRFATQRGWSTIDEKSQSTLSRVSFYFGHELYETLDVPIGLILRYNSGTPIQSWLPPEAAEEIRQELGIPAGWNDVQDNRNPGVQFHDKLAPVVPAAFRGVIWYQGERNAKAQTGWEYRHLLPFLVDTWRDLWAEKSNLARRDFPFYYVQVPTQGGNDAPEWPWLRDGMRRALADIPNGGMAVFYDHGPSLHPEHKAPAGHRLALWALAKDYDYDNLVYSGPLLRSASYRDGEAILTFDHVGGGLRNAGVGETLKFFEIAGKDGHYVTADARIVGETVVVSSSQVSKPKHVRYLFRKAVADATVSLINAEGLPASPFLTDDAKPPRGGESEPKRNSTTRVRKPATGLAPEVVDFTAADASYANEQKIPDLEEPILSTAPEDLGDGLAVGVLGQDGGDETSILKLAEEISAGEHGEVDSLLLWHDGKLLFESYYRRGRQDYPHYQMSITKSYTAMAIGRAMQLGHLSSGDLDRPVLDFLSGIDRTRLADGAESITLADALNMRSGVRVPKKGAVAKNPKQLVGQGQIEAYLTKTQPLGDRPRDYKYQSADPSMAMQVLDVAVPTSVREFLEDELLSKLGIASFGWQDDTSLLPKAAAGSSMRSRDMIKWGLLIRDRGMWRGEQLIPADYIEKATSRLYTNRQETSYGYFWWRHTAKADGQSYDCISGRGAGGQFIMYFPEVDLIAVVTAHNKGMGAMLKTLPERVLPVFADTKAAR